MLCNLTQAVLENFALLKRLSQRARYGCMPPAWYARQTGEADSALKAVRSFVSSEGVETSWQSKS